MAEKLENPFNPLSYHVGQMPAKCGHYYPDAVRLRDEIRGNDFIRIIDCELCGKQYEMKIDEEVYNGHMDVMLDEQDLDEFRKKERARLKRNF